MQTKMTTFQQQPTSAASSSSYTETNEDRQQRSQDDAGAPSEGLHPSMKADPFLYYSNDRVRMRDLRLEGVEVEDSSNDGQQEQSTSSIVRKTRITFELHPSLLLDDLMDDELLSPDFDAFLDASIVAIKQDLGAVDDVIYGLRQIILGDANRRDG